MKKMASTIEIHVSGKTHIIVKQWKGTLVCDSASATKRYRIMDGTKSEFDGWYRVTWRCTTVFVSIEIGRDTRGLWKKREGVRSVHQKRSSKFPWFLDYTRGTLFHLLDLLNVLNFVSLKQQLIPQAFALYFLSTCLHTCSILKSP